MSGEPVILVHRSSATASRPWEYQSRFSQPIPRNHSDLVKFAEIDPVYRTVVGQLREFTEVAVKVVRSRFPDSGAVIEC